MIVVIIAIVLGVSYLLFMFISFSGITPVKQDKPESEQKKQKRNCTYEEWKTLTKKEDTAFYSRDWVPTSTPNAKTSYHYNSYRETLIINKTRFLKAFNLLNKIYDFDNIILYISFSTLFDTSTANNLNTSLNNLGRAVILKDYSTISTDTFDRNICYIKIKQSKIKEVFNILSWKEIDSINIFNDSVPSLMTYKDICFSCDYSDIQLFCSSSNFFSLKLKEERCNNYYHHLYNNADDLRIAVIDCFRKQFYNLTQNHC
ncbi:MAG: hypothetical protein E7355_05980 [Clostridiales bacterium]|nr:hypothetical protein [Clostridiales bacterium]